jgi:hypothetical protein
MRGRKAEGKARMKEVLALLPINRISILPLRATKGQPALHRLNYKNQDIKICAEGFQEILNGSRTVSNEYEAENGLWRSHDG